MFDEGHVTVLLKSAPGMPCSVLKYLIGLFKHRTAKIVENAGKNLTRPTDKLGFALGERHFGNICQNTLFLE